MKKLLRSLWNPAHSSHIRAQEAVGTASHTAVFCYTNENSTEAKSREQLFITTRVNQVTASHLLTLYQWLQPEGTHLSQEVGKGWQGHLHMMCDQMHLVMPVRHISSKDPVSGSPVCAWSMPQAGQMHLPADLQP